MPGWKSEKAYFWKTAPLFRLLPPLILAIWAYDVSWLPAAVAPAPFLLAGTLVFICLVLVRKQQLALKTCIFLLSQILVFLLGWWLMQQNDIRQKSNWFAVNIAPEGKASLVKVLSDPSEKERTWRMQVGIEKLIGDTLTVNSCGYAFLSIYKDSLPFSIRKGDYLLVPADWQAIRNAGNPFEFDYATFCRRRNLFHQQICNSREVILVKKAEQQSAGIIVRGHHFCQQQLDTYVTDTTARGILQAMLLGDEAGFDPALRQAYSETGVIHIVSISGSHVGVLFLVITLLLFWLKGRHGQIIKYITGVAAIWFYVLMAGAPPSALRAALMFSIVALSITFDRQSDPLNTLVAAAFVLLLGNPAWLFAVGFQLSFGAVLGLLLFFRPLVQSWPQRTKAGRWLWAAVSASIAAETLTAPLAIFYFHNFPLFFILANLLAAILLGVIALVGGMAIITFCWLPPLAQGLSHMVTWMIALFNKIIIQVQQWSPLSFRQLQISTTELVLLYTIIVTMALFLFYRKRMTLAITLALTCILTGLLCLDKKDALKQHRIIVYNAGRTSLIEEIQGFNYIPFMPDTPYTEQYSNRQAHIGWHSRHRNGIKQLSNYFKFKGKHILLLDNELQPDTAVSLAVDVLVLTRRLKQTTARQLQTMFHPQQIVLTGIYPRWLVQQWKDSCVLINQPFHAVALDGAFVLE